MAKCLNRMFAKASVAEKSFGFLTLGFGIQTLPRLHIMTIVRQPPRCNACALRQTSSLSSSSSRQRTNPDWTYSRYAFFHRNFAILTNNRLGANESKSHEEEEEAAAASPRETVSPPPSTSSVELVEEVIGEIRLLEVTKTTKDGVRKSSDLEALEKFDIIVSPDERGGGKALDAATTPRTFELDTKRSILAPPDEPMEERMKPILAQNDVIDPHRKGWQIGDRAKKPESNFSLREALFEEAEQMAGGKTEEAFKMAIAMFCRVDPKYRRGHVEFIYKAGNLLKEYDLHTNLDAYKAIFDLFPKGPLIPKSRFQAGFFPYPRQTDCALDIIQHMERNKVIPDREFGEQIKQIFSRRSRVHQKYRRMLYWMPKFANISPFPLIPVDIRKEDAETQAKMALERICVDLENEIDIHKVENEDQDPSRLDFSSTSSSWIASAISPSQRQLISRLPKEKAIYVKGPFVVYLREKKVDHFVLWAELPDHLKIRFEEEEELLGEYMRLSKDIDELMDSDVTRQAFRGSGRKNPLAKLSCHEQRDGVILALSVLETFSKELLTAWIRYLESSNPHLCNVPVIFSLSSVPPTDLVPLDRVDDDSLVRNRDSR